MKVSNNLEEMKKYKDAADKFASELKKECEEHEQFVKETIEKLAEKDKRIEELTEENRHLQTQFDMYRALTLQKGFEDPHLMQSIRHQICGEIRESMCCIYDYKNDDYLNGWDDAMHTVYDKLDQIEKGESRC